MQIIMDLITDLFFKNAPYSSIHKKTGKCAKKLFSRETDTVLLTYI